MKERIFWIRHIFGFKLLANEYGKIINKPKYNITGCVIDYEDHMKIVKDLKKKLKKKKR